MNTESLLKSDTQLSETKTPPAVNQSSEWSWPWGQTFARLQGIAEFTGQAKINRFSWPGITTNEHALIQAMDVAGDYLVKDDGSRKAKKQAGIDQEPIKQLEDATGDAKDKCRALWELIMTGKSEGAVALIDASTPRAP